MKCKSCKLELKQGFPFEDGWLCSLGIHKDSCWNTDERFGRHKKKKKKDGAVAER